MGTESADTAPYENHFMLPSNSQPRKTLKFVNASTISGFFDFVNDSMRVGVAI
jgi:hypothetical protein